MSINWEKVIIVIMIGALTLTSVYSLDALGNPITREEAIEISKNSELVKEGMATFSFFGVVDVNYRNSSWVEQMKKGHARATYEKVPEGHSIWDVEWTFQISEWGFVGYTVIVIVDVELAKIVYEKRGVVWG